VAQEGRSVNGEALTVLSPYITLRVMRHHAERDDYDDDGCDFQDLLGQLTLARLFP